jgi:hypothetical protein
MLAACDIVSSVVVGLAFRFLVDRGLIVVMGSVSNRMSFMISFFIGCVFFLLGSLTKTKKKLGKRRMEASPLTKSSAQFDDLVAKGFRVRSAVYDDVEFKVRVGLAFSAVFHMARRRFIRAPIT